MRGEMCVDRPSRTFGTMRDGDEHLNNAVRSVCVSGQLHPLVEPQTWQT